MKACAAQRIVGVVCLFMLMHCATSNRQQSLPEQARYDQVLKEIDRSLDLLMFTDLSLQEIRSHLDHARLVSVRLAYNRETNEKGELFCREYADALSSVLSVISGSKYDAIPVLDSSNIEWPCILTIKIREHGSLLKVPLPSVNPESLGIFSLRDSCDIRCVRVTNGICSEKDRTTAAVFHDTIQKIDGIIQKVSLERIKMRIVYERLVIERKIQEAELEGRPLEPIETEIEARLHAIALKCEGGVFTIDEKALFDFESMQLSEGLKEIRDR